MKIQPRQLSAHLEKTLASCYLVTGDEHLLVAETLDSLRLAARARGFTSRELYVATASFDWAQLSAASANLSLFAEQRIVEIRIPTGKPGREGSAAIAELVAAKTPDLLLLISAAKLDKSAQASRWVKACESTGVMINVWPIGTRELPGFIAERMRLADLQPTRDAVALVADRVEGNLLAAKQEIEKLRLLLGAGAVTVDDINRAVANSSRYDVYQLVDAALAADARRTLRILHGLRAEGVPPALVIWALSRELRVLATLASAVRQGATLASAMQKARVWSARQAIVRVCLGRHTDTLFYQLLAACVRADAAAKGRLMTNPWQILTDVFLVLAGPARAAA